MNKKESESMERIIKKYLSQNQNLIALCITIIAAILLFGIFCVNGKPGVIDQGQYDNILVQLGMGRADDVYSNEEFYTRANEQFKFNGSEWERLLQINPVSSIIYPVTVVKFFGYFFDQTFYLHIYAGIMSLLTLIFLYVLVKSLYVILREQAALAGGLICLVFLCGNYVIWFNSLYNRGMFLMCFLAVLAMTARAEAIKRSEFMNSHKVVLPIMISSLLLIESIEFGIVLVPILFGVTIHYYTMKQKEKQTRIRFFAGAAAIFLIFSYNGYVSWGMIPDAGKKVMLYHSVFDGALVEAEDTKEALGYFELEESFVNDIGKTAFYPSSSYYVSPMDQQQNHRIYDNISWRKVLGYYLSHPRQLMQSVKRAVSESGSISDSRLIYEDDVLGEREQKSVVKNDWWNGLRILLYDTKGFYTNLCLLGGILAIIYYFRRKRDVSLFIIFLIFTSLASVVVIYMFTGEAGISEYIVIFQMISDFLCVIIVCLVAGLIKELCYWICYSSISMRKKEKMVYLKEEYKILLDEPELLKKKERWKRFISQCLKDQKKAAVLSTFICSSVMIMVLFFPRIGAYNNGDYGRILDACGLTFNSYDYSHPSEQCVIKVIEQYDYIEPYDWSNLRPDKLMLSQAYMSALLRVWYKLTGVTFSSAAATVIYCIILTISFYHIMKFVHEWIGTYTILFAVCFTLMFCCSYNLGWINSMFGEGVGFTGLMMVLGSSLALMEKKNGEKGISGKLMLVEAASYLLVCGKSQYTVLLPVLIVWVMILVVYYFPSGFIKRAGAVAGTMIFLAASVTAAIHVFQHDSEISSPDTLYQGLCNGILVVADNPYKALQELGLNASLAQDRGKNAYLPKEQYYCAPRSELAEELIYSKVSSIDYLKWYLSHPSKFIQMMDVAAKASRDSMPDYFLYTGERTDEKHRMVSKLDGWKDFRKYLTPSIFLLYVLIFGTIVVFCLVKIISKKTSGRVKLNYTLFIILMALGVFEYPLSVIGNGYSDNIKQLYLFRVVYDCMLLGCGTYLLYIRRSAKERTWKSEKRGLVI